MDFVAYQQILEAEPLRFWLVLAVTVLGMGLYTWCCLDDVKKRSVVTWKLMLPCTVLSFAAVLSSLLPEPLGCGCPYLWPYMLVGWTVWMVLMLVNMHVNSQRFVGQADLTILMWVAAQTTAYVLWIMEVSDERFAILYAVDAVYFVVYALVLGMLVLVLCMLGQLVAKKVRDRLSWKQALKQMEKAPMLVAFWPAMLVLSYLLLTT